jgi:hypothetical protein
VRKFDTSPENIADIERDAKRLADLCDIHKIMETEN